MLHDCFRFKQPTSAQLEPLMEALHIMTGAAWSYSTVSDTILYCAMQCSLMYWTVAPAMDKEYGGIFAASLTCDVKLCLCQLTHHGAGNHNHDSHACLTDSAK